MNRLHKSIFIIVINSRLIKVRLLQKSRIIGNNISACIFMHYLQVFVANRMNGRDFPIDFA